MPTNSTLTYIMTLSFSLWLACLGMTLLCGVAIYLRSRSINAAMKHPFLDHGEFRRYSLSIRASILLDYFFRLVFPHSTRWVLGDANNLLRHVDPEKTPMSVKWPIIGFWGGCLLGMPAMICLWVSMMLRAL
jgi:hypothetical protein